MTGADDPLRTRAERDGQGGEPGMQAAGRSGPELRLLGGFSLALLDAPVDVPDASQRVLVYLALHDRPQARQVVAASLWPDSTEARAAANLRSALWRLPSPEGVPLYVSRGSVLAVAPEVEVDVRRVEATGRALVNDASRRHDPAHRRMFFEDLLPGWYDDFVIVERERLAQLRLHFLEALALALLDQDRIVDALDVALRLVAADQLRERSQRALIAIYRAEGSIGQAVRQYERYRALLRETFGCDPSPDLATLAFGLADAESIGA